MTEQPDRKDLKIQALLEKISKITSAYENQEADYRVDITLLVAENEKLSKQLEELEAPVAKKEA